ncbi:Arm DNA-binding domain-containing protein [Pantoea ananatis]|uniref:Arm DNA-binding domain-containing protein n=1 Tax=Pantoea ananas TaxID=553 RepID=UPI002220DCC3|nr:Arm DNA-binding domain-containing protein [Pantoea ananatis]
MADSNGLCIEVRPTGSKAWRYRYRYAGKPSIVTIDEYPAMSLMQARAERDKLRVLLKGGAMNTTFGAIGLELLTKRQPPSRLATFCAHFGPTKAPR